MTPNLKISQTFINRLPHVSRDCFYYVYGIIYDNSLLVLGLFAEELSILDCFPTEVDLCGVVGIAEDDYNSPVATKLLKDVDVTDTPLFLSYKFEESNRLTAGFIVHGKLEETTYEVYNDAEINSQFKILRLQAILPFMFDMQKQEIIESSTNLRKQLTSGDVVFELFKRKVYLTGSDGESRVVGFSGEKSFLQLYEHLMRDCWKDKKFYIKKDLNDVLPVTMLRKVTKETSETSNEHALIIDVNKRITQYIQLPLMIDAIAMVHRSTKVFKLYTILIESLCRNLRCIEKSFVHQFKPIAEMSKIQTVDVPVPYHFFPEVFGHYITIFYPKCYSHLQLSSQRKMLHDKLLLSNTPCFTRTLACNFEEEEEDQGTKHLINPHESISNYSPVGDLYLVQGKYYYYHYNQDGFNDSGWGCAYRSIQTLFSWYRLQGYTDEKIPNHRDIQLRLSNYDEGSKDLVGSKKWIGSMDVCNFLMKSGFDATIIPLHAGTRFSDIGPQLAVHFKTHGTPVMIGGGDLAHTILGVDYNQISNAIRFLVLDPHYEGVDDIKEILKKGWCAWKNQDFWKKSTFYNLCLPCKPRKCV